jgi:hypothetical protein
MQAERRLTTACPICSPACAALLSSLGLGSLATTYLLAITIGFLAVAVAALARGGSSRRGFSPFLIGIIAALGVLGGKFWLHSDLTTYVAVGLLVVASIWNAIPKPPGSCPAFRQSPAPEHPEGIEKDADGHSKTSNRDLQRRLPDMQGRH